MTLLVFNESQLRYESIPSVTGKEVIAALSKVGSEVARVRGSHHIMIHSDGRRTVVPVHSGETISRGL